MMLGMAPDYDHLMVIQKVEVFEHALDSTSGAPSSSVATSSAYLALQCDHCVAAVSSRATAGCVFVII